MGLALRAPGVERQGVRGVVALVGEVGGGGSVLRHWARRNARWDVVGGRLGRLLGC